MEYYSKIARAEKRPLRFHGSSARAAAIASHRSGMHALWQEVPMTSVKHASEMNTRIAQTQLTAVGQANGPMPFAEARCANIFQQRSNHKTRLGSLGLRQAPDYSGQNVISKFLALRQLVIRLVFKTTESICDNLQRFFEVFCTHRKMNFCRVLRKV